MLSNDKEIYKTYQ